MAKSREVIEKSITQSTRAMDIMKRFSQFAKSKGGDPNQEKINLKGTIEGVLQLVSYEVTTEGIEINIQVSSDLNVLFDPRHLEQVLFNLIRNACQEIGKGGKVTISSSLKTNKVSMAISDNGPGIPKERLSQIFEPFYSTKEEGSGVGLYVTKQLVERNGGKTTVESKIGEGTTFTLELKSESV